MSERWKPPSFSQQPYRCRLYWGPRGAHQAAAAGDLLVVVDTLSFSSAVATAVQHGGIVYPCSPSEDVAALAQHVGGVAAVGRRDVPARGRFSLSPLTFVDLVPGTRVVLASPNGGLCSHSARGAAAVLAGALLNAKAVAAAAEQLLATTDRCLSIVACGERCLAPDDGDTLRMAIEDYLAAGAILAHLSHPKSPEAVVCEGGFRHVQRDITELLWECEGGLELRGKGVGADR